MTCSRCGKQWCWQCQQVYHPGYSCERWKREKYIRPFKIAFGIFVFLCLTWSLLNMGRWIFDTYICQVIWQIVKYPFIGVWVLLVLIKNVIFSFGSVVVGMLSSILPEAVNEMGRFTSDVALSIIYSVFGVAKNYIYYPFDFVMGLFWRIVISIFYYLFTGIYYSLYYFIYGILKIITFPITLLSTTH